MAVTRAPGPVLDGLRPARGSIRLVALRWALVLVSSLPALIAGAGGVASGAAQMPYYTDVEGRLPVSHFVRLLGDLPRAFLPAVIVSIVLAVVADQVLLGGAIALLDPGRPVGDRVKVLATVCREGLTHIWAFLRVVLLGLVLSAAGLAILRAVFRRIFIAGERASFSGATMVMTLPLLAGLLGLVWIATAGAWVFWCRLITAADDRRRVRRTGLLVLRVFWRNPLRSWGLFVALTSISTLVSGAVLFAWRQAEPRSGFAIVLWALGWLFTLGVQAFIWLWLLRSGRLLYASERYSDVRSRGDDPLGIARVMRFWRRKKSGDAIVAPTAKDPAKGDSPDA